MRRAGNFKKKEGKSESMTQQEHRVQLHLTREVIKNPKAKPEIKGIWKSKLKVNSVKFSTRHNTLV